jgi:hypothetical protein
MSEPLLTEFMALSDYRGETPEGRTDVTVVRVAPRRLWKPGGRATATCAQTGERLPGDETHLLVELDGGEGRTRKCFRDESSFRAWLAGE